MKSSEPLIAVAAILASTACLNANDLWYAGHTYKLTSTPGSWFDAEAEAISMGGHLVAINDAAEQSAVESHFETLSPDPFYLWIGLTDSAREGVWSWSNGDPLLYSNWAGLEPKGPGDPDNVLENWAFMNFEHNFRNGEWHDVDVNRVHLGIIECVPEPATTAAGLFAISLATVSLFRRSRA